VPHIQRASRSFDAKYERLIAMLSELIVAVRESSDDPTYTDIFRRQSIVQLNGTVSLGKVPPGEFWIIDYVSASAAGWTIKNDAYTILWSVANGNATFNEPVALPGDEIYFVTTALTDAIVQLQRRPMPQLPIPAHTGRSDERVSGTGVRHATERDLIDVPYPHPARVPNVA
jgi:hypothetical protein